MPRPIDADAIVNYHVTCSNGKEYVLLPVKTLAEYPTLDYAPVRHGEWEYPLGMAWHYVCSECGYGQPSMVVKTKFCPNCGAKMDGGKQ